MWLSDALQLMSKRLTVTGVKAASTGSVSLNNIQAHATVGQQVYIIAALSQSKWVLRGRPVKRGNRAP